MPSGLDQSWGYADPKSAASAGVQVVSMYLSYDSSKNITPSKVRAYHKVGIASLLNWESQAGAPLNGAGQGKSDATEAVRQAKELIRQVGYAPKAKLAIYFSCDTNVSSGQYGAIDAYYRAARDVVHASGFLLGAYGEADLVQHLADAKITDVEWQTLAWSNGVIAPAADFYQSSINDSLGGASVDFDQVIHPASLGAWWPPGNKYDSIGAQIMASLDATDKKWLLDNLGPAKVADAILQRKVTLRKEYVHPAPTKDDVTYSVQSFLLGTWNYARGADYNGLSTTSIARAVVEALPKTSNTLSEADVEAAVRKVLDGAQLHTSQPPTA